jgi:hypothetical protein
MHLRVFFYLDQAHQSQRLMLLLFPNYYMSFSQERVSERFPQELVPDEFTFPFGVLL